MRHPCHNYRRFRAARMAWIGGVQTVVRRFPVDVKDGRDHQPPHRASKEAIFLALMDEHMRAEVGALSAILQETSSLEDLLDRVAALYAAMHAEPATCILSVAFQLLAFRPQPRSSKAISRAVERTPERLGDPSDRGCRKTENAVESTGAGCDRCACRPSARIGAPTSHWPHQWGAFR